MPGPEQRPGGESGDPRDPSETATPPAAGTVALAGRPNVGKSTLLNRLVRRKAAIVTPVPQTTRNVIPGLWPDPGGAILLLDTPGIHRPRHLMNRRMVRSAFRAMRGADLIVVLVDAQAGVRPADRFVIGGLTDLQLPLLLLLNKVDRIRKPLLLPQIEELARLADFREIVPISALRGDNCERLRELILSHLPPPAVPPAPAEPGEPVEEFQAGEIIREKVFLAIREEIPHSTAVLVDRREDRPSGTWLFATILVERESHKPILIGRQGSMLKVIGEQARREIEARWGRKVILKLWVRAQEGWRGSEAVLGRIGLPTDR